MVRAVGAAMLLLSLSVLAAGCSGKFVDDEDEDSSSGGTSSKPKPSPVVQCQTYASTWCTKAFGCYVQVGRLDEGSRQYNVDECTRVIVENFPCSAATSVSAEFDKCISQVKGMACSKWNVPQTQFVTVRAPATCDTAINFE